MQQFDKDLLAHHCIKSSRPWLFISSQVETGMTYDRDQIRKWLLLGGSKCPLTGVQLVTRKVGSHWLGVSCSRAEPCKASTTMHQHLQAMP